jgi:Conserved TM helix
MEVPMWEQIKQALIQSTARFLTEFASLLPGLAALILAVLLSIVIGWILAVVVRRVLVGLRFDERMARWGFASVGEGSPLGSPASLAARALFLLVVLTGFLIGVAAFDFAWTSLFVRSILSYIPNIIGAVLVLVVGTIIARFVARSVLIGAVNLNLQYARLLSEGIKWLVLVLSVAMALEHLRIARGIVELAFGILFGGIVFGLALAIALGSKDLVTKSLERDTKKTSEEVEDPLRHL